MTKADLNPILTGRNLDVHVEKEMLFVSSQLALSNKRITDKYKSVSDEILDSFNIQRLFSKVISLHRSIIAL